MMTNQNCCDDEAEKCCEEEISCVPPRILSKEATDEILGDNLCLLIAVGKNGEAVRYLPYGTDESELEFADSVDEDVNYLEISIEIPKIPEVTGDNVVNDSRLKKKCVIRAAKRCLCKFGGSQWYC